MSTKKSYQFTYDRSEWPISRNGLVKIGDEKKSNSLHES